MAPWASRALAVAALGGFVGCALDADESDPEVPSTERLAPAAFASIAMAIPDDAGTLHDATLVTSRDLVPRMWDLLAGARAIVGTAKTGRLAAGDRGSYLQRTSDATTAVAKAAGAGYTALLAVVFEDPSVIGWRGPFGSASGPGVQDTQGGHTYVDVLTTTPSTPVAVSTSAWCPAGAGAHGFLNSLSGGASTSVQMFWQHPFAPFATEFPFSGAVTLQNVGVSYNWPAIEVQSWFYVKSTQPSPAAGSWTTVISYFDCYHYGF